jgi:hypothetical protein
MIEHLCNAGQIQGEGSVVFGVQTILIWTLALGTFDTLTIIQNKLEMRELWAPKLKGVKNSKNKSSNTTKVSFQTFKKKLLCCFVVVKVPRWFVEVLVAFL